MRHTVFAPGAGVYHARGVIIFELCQPATRKWRNVNECCSKEKEMISYNYPQCPRKCFIPSFCCKGGRKKPTENFQYFPVFLETFKVIFYRNFRYAHWCDHLAPWWFHCFVHNFIVFKFEGVAYNIQSAPSVGFPPREILDNRTQIS